MFFHYFRLKKILQITRNITDKWTRYWNLTLSLAYGMKSFGFGRMKCPACVCVWLREAFLSAHGTVVGSWLTAQQRAWSPWSYCRSSAASSQSTFHHKDFSMQSMWYKKKYSMSACGFVISSLSYCCSFQLSLCLLAFKHEKFWWGFCHIWNQTWRKIAGAAQPVRGVWWANVFRKPYW